MKHKVLTLLLGVGLMLEAGAVDKTFNDLVELAGPAASNDWFVLWDTSVGDARKISPNNFFATAGLWDFEEGWVTATVYALNDVVAHNTGLYICKTSHTAGTATEPGVGADWTTVWLEMVAPAGNTTLATARVAFGDEGNSLTSEAGFEYNASTNTLSVPNASVTGLSVTGAPRTVPSAMAALEVDLTKALNTKTISGNVTLTFSGSLAAGQWSELQLQNTGGSVATVNLPASVYDGNAGPTVASVAVPAAVGGVNGRTHVVFSSDGTNTLVYQGGGSGGGGVAALTPWSSDINGSGFDLTNVGDIVASTVSADLSNSTDVPGSEIIGPLPDLVYGKITTDAAMEYTATVVAATTAAVTNIETTKTYLVVTLNETEETLAFTGTPNEGTSLLVRFVPHTADVTVTVPSVYSLSLGTNRTSFMIRANKPALWQLWRSNGAWFSYEPAELPDLPAAASPATTALVETADATTGSSGKTTIAQLLAAGGAKTTRTGVRRTMYVNAGAMIPRTTNGAQRSTVELATSDIMYDVLLFDTTTAEAAGVWVQMPPTWDGSTVTAKAHWTATAGTAAQTVQWQFSARGFGNDDVLDQSLPAATAVSDALIATGDMHITSTSAAITVAGTATAGTPVYFQVARDVAGDNLAADAGLLGFVIEYTESTTEPAAQ